MATVSSAGQVTLPPEVYDSLGLGPGSVVRFVQTEKGQWAVRAPRNSAAQCLGTLEYDGPAVTVDQMNEEIGAAGYGA